MTTITLKYVKSRKAFRVQGTGLYFGPVKSVAEFGDMAEYLGRQLCDNPTVQAMLGVLGEDQVKFKLAA